MYAPNVHMYVCTIMCAISVNFGSYYGHKNKVSFILNISVLDIRNRKYLIRLIISKKRFTLS